MPEGGGLIKNDGECGRKNEKPHARGERGAGIASKVRRSLPNNRKRLSQPGYEKWALPDARRKIDRQTDYSWQEHKEEKETIRRSQKSADHIEGYAGQLITN
jgi:hypothetical protein